MIFSISLVAEKIFTLGPLPVTNSLLTTWLGVILTSLLFILGMRKKSIIPHGTQVVLESIYTFFLNLCENVLGEKKLAEKAVPFIATLFIFVFTTNIFEVIPGVGSIGFFEHQEIQAQEIPSPEIQN